MITFRWLRREEKTWCLRHKELLTRCSGDPAPHEKKRGECRAATRSRCIEGIDIFIFERGKKERK